MNKHFQLIFFVIICILSQIGQLLAQESLNLMFYNIYRYPYHSPSNREFLLKEINNETAPDILMVCELVDEYGADRLLEVAFQDLPDSYGRAPFVASPTATYDPLHQMVFFNQRKLALAHHQQHLTEVRDINQYTFYLKTEGLLVQDTTYLEVFVTHLKSSDGQQNRWVRKAMIDTFFKALEQVPEGRAIVFGGDFNFYDAHLEPGYNKLISSNNSTVMKDPMDAYGKWHNNEQYQGIHTQSTRVSTQGFGSGGAGGGMDDRFDFIFLSENLWNHGKLKYQDGSYQAIGNNNNCFKNRIDAPECDGFFAQNLREKLYYMSDHLPVFLKLEVEGEWSEPISIISDKEPDLNFLPKGNNVKNDLWIQKPASLEGAIEYRLLDALGRVVISGQLFDHQPLAIDLSNKIRGIYFMSFYVESVGKITYKVVK